MKRTKQNANYEARKEEIYWKRFKINYHYYCWCFCHGHYRYHTCEPHCDCHCHSMLLSLQLSSSLSLKFLHIINVTSLYRCLSFSGMNFRLTIANSSKLLLHTTRHLARGSYLSVPATSTKSRQSSKVARITTQSMQAFGTALYGGCLQFGHSLKIWE